MGEAMSESGDFAHAKARALLEVVRLAFEGGIGFETEFLSSNSTTAQGDAQDQPANHGSSRPKVKHAKELAQQPTHVPHRPASTGSSSRLVPGGPCMWCGVTATPQWRRPRGTNKLLCNACGIFFTRYGRLPERTHHVHAAVSQAVATDTAASGSVTTSAGATGNLTCPPPRGDAKPSPVEPADQRNADAGDADGPVQHQTQGLPVMPGQPQGAASPPALPSWHEQQKQQHTGLTSSLIVGLSPHKRKALSQPETELLLRCVEEHCPEGANLVSVDMDTTVAPAPPLVPTSRPAPSTHQPHQPFGVALQPQLASAASADQSPPTLLTVAPLDLNLQQISEMQQLGLLRPSLAGIGALPFVRYLQDPVAAAAVAAAAGDTTTASSSAAAAVVAAARVLGYRGLLQSPGLMGPATTLPTILPEELLGLPYVPPLGRMPGDPKPLLDVAAAQPPPQSLYGRLAKRHERLPVGESEDSNVSTDSHAAGQCDAGGTSHDEDEGGTTTTGPTITATTTTTSTTTAGTTSSTVFVKPLSGLSCSPPSMPGGPQAHLPSILTQPLAIAAALLPTMEDAVPKPSDDGQLRRQLVQLQQQLQQQQEVIFLHARKSKGPRSRAASATPSSSTLS